MDDHHDLERGGDGITVEETTAVGAEEASVVRRIEVTEDFIGTQGFTLSIACHAVYFSLITSLISLIQVKYQNRDDSPFETHPVNMTVFWVALCIYGLAIPMKLKVQRHTTFRSSYSRIFNHVILVFRLLSLVSLVSIFIPNYLNWLLFVMWTVFSIIEVAEDLMHQNF